MTNFDNLDDRIDWPSFYGRYIDRISPTAAGDVAVKCPFHEHTNKTSFSINTKTGQWQCFACDKRGNAYQFLAEQGMSKEQAIDEVRRAAGLPPKGEGGDIVALVRAKMTIEKYAAEKHLDVAFLKELGLRNPAGKGTGMAIPYLDESGIEVATRYRQVSTPSSPKFLWKKGSRTRLYGLGRIDRVRTSVETRGRLILVEGESDCHTMWQRGYDEVLGVPGSNTFRAEWAALLPAGHHVYYVREPGMSGDQFSSTLCKKLTEANWSGTLMELSLHEQGVKDPSDLHINHGAKFDAIMEAAIIAARPVDYRAATLKPEDIVPGFPALRQPDGFRLDAEKGVLGVNKDGVWFNVCPVPVGLGRRLRSVDTGEEKVEVLFRRDGQVHALAEERSTVFTTRGITQLANSGLPVNSENAQKLVRYLSALEGENLETLPRHRCIDRMGWVDSKTFLPGVAGDDVYIDAEGSDQLAKAYHENGDPKAWLELAGHVRANHPTARLMLAASFAAPLLTKLQQRVFILHAWGQSRGGKTAATKLALSAWGNPEDLLATFNATKVYLEQTAAFYSDLPLGVDELQVSDPKVAENIVYMLSLGKGRGRGARGGGVQTSRAWRSIVITTGEQPLTSANSHGGVVSRAVEVCGSPIDGDEALARRLHQSTIDHYGHAGPEFIRHLLRHESLQVDWKAMIDELEGTATANTSSHVASVAVCCLADYLSGMWLWDGDPLVAWAEAVQMGRRVLGGLDKASDTDYAERAREYVEGWIMANQKAFTDEDHHTILGRVEIDAIRPERSATWIIPSMFDEAMQRAGLNTKRVLSDFADRGWIKTELDGSRLRTTVRSRVLGRQMRLIGFMFANEDAPIQDALITSDPNVVF